MLRAVRLAKGLTLRDVAERADVDPGHLSKVERGDKLLGLDSMYRVAVALGLTEFAQMLALYLPRVEQR